MNKIDYEIYKKYACSVSSLNQEQLNEALTILKGKSTEDEYEEVIDDCAVSLLSKFLRLDWGRSIVFEYSQSQKKFLKSKELSNYFKESIKELLGDSISEELENILNSDKDINDMSEEEIKALYLEVENYYKTNGKSPKSNISSRLMSYFYKLNGKGVLSYIKNTTYPSILAREILLTCGLNDRSSYYSGRGVNYGDLNDKNLVAIYKKLLKFDPSYAKDFVELVNNMRTLGATEFIDSFINFGYSNFSLKKDVISDENVSLNGVHGDARYVVAAVSMFEFGRRDEGYQVSATEDMKEAFNCKIEYIQDKLEKGEELTEKDIEYLDSAMQYGMGYHYRPHRPGYPRKRR